MALMSVAVLAASQVETELVEHEETVPLPPYVYGISALVIFLVCLLVVTRLDLDR